MAVRIMLSTIMTQVFTKTIDQLFEEIVERGQADMAHTKEEYDALVEAVINDNIDLGGLSIDQDTEGCETMLKERFDEYSTRFLAE